MKIMTLFSRLLTVTACTLAFISMTASAPKVTASLDSAYILMGKQTTLHLEAQIPEAAGQFQVLLPADTLVDKIEIIRVNSDTTIANGLVALRNDIIIQSFDSGLYAIPPIRVIAGADTALSNHLILKVIPVPVDTLKGKIHEYAGVAEPPHHFLDFIPGSPVDWFRWITGIILLAGLIYAVYFYVFIERRRRPFRESKVVIVPPYEQAKGALEKLREEHLCEKGQEREFYTRLTDILRVYLDRRFGISAMEMTSGDILRALSDNQETRWSRSQIEQVLSMADFVKFAKMRPLPDDNLRTFRSVEEFVENTRPQPQPEEGETAVAESKDKNKQPKTK